MNSFLAVKTSVKTQRYGENIFYNGTLENIDISVSRDNCVVNLYGGKIKCDTNALVCYMQYSSIINIYDTVLETSDGTADIYAYFYDTDTAHTVINVADYSGDGLTIDAWIDITGKFKLLEGIENAEEAEKYTVNYSNGTYGTKVKKAMEYNDKGCNIQIIKESDLLPAVK